MNEPLFGREAFLQGIGLETAKIVCGERISWTVTGVNKTPPDPLIRIRFKEGRTRT